MINIDSSYKTWKDLGIDASLNVNIVSEILKSFLGSNKYLIIFFPKETNILSEYAKIIINPLIVTKDEDLYSSYVSFRGQCIGLCYKDFKTHRSFWIENHISTDIRVFIGEDIELDEMYFKIVQKEELGDILFNATFTVYNTCVNFLK